jgi:N-succinyldiaminopimelate aminotransferase
MNNQIKLLQPYPFERMNALKAGCTGNEEFPHVALSIGEPRHPPPPEIVDVLSSRELLRADLGTYPATRGGEFLREQISAWLKHRFQVKVRADDQILPVSGTREALFSFAQAVLSRKPGSLCLIPNPFYQIYEGAALLGGATPYFLNSSAANGYLPDYRSIPDDIWAHCELLFVCSPGNPSGRVLPAREISWLLDKAAEYGFVIAADECYSELYPDETRPPAGFLEVAGKDGQDEYDNLVVFHSLSKRSNLPGLRSGFVAGDAKVLSDYYQYRTYEGCALPADVQRASAAAWADENHVIDNRAQYREKFSAITPILATAFDVNDPEGGFYHWLNVQCDDQQFALDLFRDVNITVLPGSFISRDADGQNPGAEHIRVAWVAERDSCLEAAERLVSWALARGRH